MDADRRAHEYRLRFADDSTVELREPSARAAVEVAGRRPLEIIDRTETRAWIDSIRASRTKVPS